MADRDFRVKNGLYVGTDAYITGDITSVDSIQFDLNAVEAVSPGQLAWNAEENTIDLVLTGNVTMQVGQEQFYYIKNKTGSTIPNGSVVRAAGTLGLSGRILGALAVADGSIPSKYIIGIATEDIPNDADGFVSAFGKIRGLDTTAFSEGDILYADPAVPGGLSNTAPRAPNNIVTVAIVVTKDNNQGELFVRPTYGSSILEDESVFVNNLQTGDSIFWVGANSRFETRQGVSVEGYQANDGVTLGLARANDGATLLSARANDYNTYTTLQSEYRANDGVTLGFARANDGATLLSARANDYSTYTTLQSEYRANDGATLGLARSNDGATLLSARSNDYSTYVTLQSEYRANDGATLLSARANDYSTYVTLQSEYRANDYATWSGLNSFIALKANTASPTFTGIVAIADNISHDGDADTSFGFPATDTFSVTTAGSERVRVVSNGNIGIGSTSPSTLLEIAGSSTATKVRIRNTQAGPTTFGQDSIGLELISGGLNASAKYMPAIKFGTTDPELATTNPKFGAAITAEASEGYATDTDGGMHLSLWTSPDDPGTAGGMLERVRVTQTGNVGVGTTSPSSALQVIGTITANAFVGINRYLQIIAVEKATALVNAADIIGAVEVPVNGIITGLRAKTSSGTCTVTFKLNGSTIGTVSATSAGVSSSTSNSVSALDDLTFDVASASGSGLVLTITLREL